MTPAENRERQISLKAEANDFIAKAEATGHGLSVADENHFNGLMRNLAELEATSATAASDSFNVDSASLNALRSQQVAGRYPVEGRQAPQADGFRKFKDSNGGDILAYNASQPLTSGASYGEIGESIQGIVTGDIQNAQIGSTDSAGGYTLTPGLSTMTVDLLRANQVCMKAGAVIVPMNSAELVFATVTGDPTASWTREAAAITSSEVTFGAKTLRPKKLAAIISISEELIQDSTNAAELVGEVAIRAIGVEADRAALMGTGASAEPLGIRNHTGVNTISSVGLPADFSHVSLGAGDILQANYQGDVSSLAWINSVRTDDTYDGLQDTTNQPMRMPPRVEKLQRYTTTSLPLTEGSSESVSIVGAFENMVFGYGCNPVLHVGKMVVTR